MSLLNFNDAETSLCQTIQIPYYILKKTGEFLLPEDQKNDKIEFVWLAMSRSRVLWDKYNPGEKTVPICRSADAQTPDGGIAKKNCRCEACPDSKWTKDQRKQDVRPACAEIFTLLCWDIERKTPFYFQVKRTGITSLKLFHNTVKIGELTTKSKYPYHVSVKSRLAIKKASTKFDDVYTPSFDIAGALDEKEAEFYYDLAKQLSNEIGNVQFEKFENGDTNGESKVENGNNGGGYKQSLPDFMTNWMNEKVGLKITGDLTWNDLLQDKAIQGEGGVSTSGLAYLRKLAQWKERPDVWELANMALSTLEVKE